MTVEPVEHVVLVVDDDRNLLHALSRVLRPQSYRLYTATSAEEAMLVLKSHKVDVLVSDEQMPGMRGCDLLIWVAEHYPDVARIVLTGHATTANAIRAINQGHVLQFFTKPCDPLDLDMIIRKALDHRMLLDEDRRIADASRHQIRESQRLRAMTEALVQIVAHDVQKPLQSISGNCRALQDRPGHVLDDGAKELVNQALEGVMEVARLVGELNVRCQKASPAGMVGPSSPALQQGKRP
jgi:response regulator RpfG family c-di-GMP phosphodiesterase